MILQISVFTFSLAAFTKKQFENKQKAPLSIFKITDMKTERKTIKEIHQ